MAISGGAAAGGLIERRFLQTVVTLACVVPIAAGSDGVLRGLAMVGQAAPAPADSHYRYLSGLLLGIGIAFLSTVPHIENHTRRFALLTGIVVIGGAGRLAALIANGVPDNTMLFALAMELGVTPALMLWQRRIAGLSQVRADRRS
jgi:hypothetical protein